VGAAARRKRERVKLTEAQFYRLKALIAQRALLQNQLQQQLAGADQRISEAMMACGLTPGVQYEMDEKLFTATART
jgi:hypothetical protein